MYVVIVRLVIFVLLMIKLIMNIWMIDKNNLEVEKNVKKQRLFLTKIVFIVPNNRKVDLIVFK